MVINSFYGQLNAKKQAVVYTRFIDKPGMNSTKIVVFLNDGFLKNVNLVQTVAYIYTLSWVLLWFAVV